MKEELEASRRTFLNYVGASTLLSILPNPVTGKAYAASEKNISEEWLALARKYGEPTGKFGKIGEPVTLNIGYIPYTSIFWVSTINKQAQILEKYLLRGSKVVWFKALSGPPIIKNMEAGKNQFAYMADAPALVAGDKVSCSCIGITSYTMGEIGSLCISKKYLESGEIKEPKDLDGKKIAISFGSFSHRQILTLMKEYQIKPILENQTVDQQMISLANGNVHIVLIGEPYASWLEQRGIIKRWLLGREIPNTSKFYFPELKTDQFQIAGATLAIHDWIRERPDIIRAYLKAEEECRDMLNHDPDLAAYFIWMDISEVPPAIVRNALDMLVWDGRINGEMKKHLKACARMWREEAFLKSPRSENPDQYVEEWVDDRMLRLAMKELEVEGFWTSDRLTGFPNPIKPEQHQRHDWKKYENIILETKPWKPTKI
jgi:NitT/TauT family transport system substrate-binding protein